MTQTDRPGLFSTVVPNLQLVWDATSYSDLLTCPRKYQLHILDGWGSKGVDVEFGAFYATGVETFHKARLEGISKLDATIRALQAVTEATWNDGEPWGGRYEQVWRCTGTEKYRNKKGNAAKCPWSHKGKWFPAPGPSQCGECGSPTEEERQWIPLDKAKDRYHLLQAVAGYCDAQPEDPADGLRAIKMPDGTDGVEKHFMMPLPFTASTGEPYTLAGYWDRAAMFGDEGLVVDNKSTRNALDRRYWSKFDLNVQLDFYDIVGSTLFNYKGVAIEAMQTMVGGQRYDMKIFNRSDAIKEEALRDMQVNLQEAERYAKDNYWPMKKTACYMCPFNKVCDKEPSQRQRYLEDGFKKRRWNPAEER